MTERRWFRDGALHKDAPTSTADRMQHERCLARIAADALLLKKGEEHDETGHSLTDISFAAYLKRIGAPQATRDLCSAWWTVSGNGDPTRVPISEFLTSCAHGGGPPDSMIAVSTDGLVGGVTLLAKRMIASSEAALLRNAAVTRITYDSSGVTAHASDGRSWRARAALLATGINPLAAIVFDPPLPPAQVAALATGHIGASVKIWAKVADVPIGVLATGGGDGIEWMFSERLAKDGVATLVVGFGLARNFDPAKSDVVEAATVRFFPEARLLAYDWHDWVGDPFARGTWVAPVLGAEQALAPATWRMIGPLAFASSDIASEDAAISRARCIRAWARPMKSHGFSENLTPHDRRQRKRRWKMVTDNGCFGTTKKPAGNSLSQRAELIRQAALWHGEFPHSGPHPRSSVEGARRGLAS